MKRSDPASYSFANLGALPLGLSLLAFAACSGSGGATVGEANGRSGDFAVLKTDPVNGSTVFLNDPISIDFSNDVDIDSATLTTMNFQALDQQGEAVSDLVVGNFTVGTSPGDSQPGRRLQFVPRFASNNSYSDGGLKAGRSYLVQLVGGGANNNTVLRNMAGRALSQPLTFTFSTRDGTQPAQLFRNPKSGGPSRVGMTVSTAASLDEVPLGLFGSPPLEIRLDFDQALNPNDGNVPVSFDIDPENRDINDRGRIYLEYDDPTFGVDTWIPAEVELERNDPTGATVVLRPAGVLPNNATVRVIVESTLEDISGENSQSNPQYNRVFGEFKTSESYQQQWNGIAEDFMNSPNIDPLASFPESQAEVGPGYVRAGFAFEGNSTSLEYEPQANEVVLNTAFTQIVPKAGLPFTVTGGTFNFKNVTIPQGVTVRGQGPNPMVWLCSGKFTVAGTLTVSGGDGARVDTLTSANFAKAGGVGVCGGGNGGEGTPSATLRDLRGGIGRGPNQAAGGGGRGGYLSCTSGCYTDPNQYDGSGGGSGGGGGTMATQGDPNWRGTVPSGTVPNTAGATQFQQFLGYGGSGCSGSSATRTQFLAGGEPGDLIFTDSRIDNNFWGSAIDVNQNLRIVGELSVPSGGSGGGGGGDTSPGNICSLTGNDPKKDFSGGGGGGGGGVLIVKALEEITVLQTGKIQANGGNGGGGEQVGACGEGGGGGGGAAGMVILMSAKAIVIEAHGDQSIGAQGRYVYGSPSTVSTPEHPFLGNDYDFAISADGGVCTTGGFGSVQVQGKYRANGQAMISGNSYDGEPLGGLGGMGIVQLMVPPGENLVDNTNTRLDDQIIFARPGTVNPATPFGIPFQGSAKRQLIGWRGYPDEFGVFVDDLGAPTNIGNNEGDIRPAPTLMPVPFNAKSRVRSKWIDTGFSVRRDLAGADGLARGVDTSNGAQVGPMFEFAGLDVNSINAGYVDYQEVGQSVRINYPAVGSPITLTGIDADASYLGQPAFRFRLDGPLPGSDNRYVNYEAELLNAADTLLKGYRILSHVGNEVLVEPLAGPIPDAVKLQVRAKFFKIVTDGAEGLGATYSSVSQPPVPIPLANVRIGFAFHQNPGDPASRFPANNQEFVRDLQDQEFLDWVATNGPPRFVQWDVLFDMTFQPGVAVPPALNPSTPRPQIEYLRLPFRF